LKKSHFDFRSHFFSKLNKKLFDYYKTNLIIAVIDMSFNNLVNAINAIPSKEAFTPVQRNSLHPFSTIIHRRVACESNGSDENCLAYLATARSGSEYTRLNSNGILSVEMDTKDGKNQGMSVSTSCYYSKHVKSGTIPLEYLPSELYELDAQSGTVKIQGIEYGLVKCFHCSVPTAQDFSIGEALELRGKHDQCMIDDNFCLYFENSEHALISLRHRTNKEEDSNFEFYNQNRNVRFKHPFFNLLHWTPCNTFFVKLPACFAVLVISKKSIVEEIDKMKENEQSTVKALLRAFEIADLSSIEGINSSIEVMMLSRDLSLLSSEQRNHIVEIIDYYVDDIYGEDSTEYLVNLRPSILFDR
jgi:hypothetical protein